MFNDIKSIIPKAIERAGLSKKISEADLFEVVAQEINNFLPSEERNKIRPVFLRDSTIIIASLSDLASEAIKQNSQKILANINNKTNNQEITEIKVLT